jgi:hypothetical protein
MNTRNIGGIIHTAGRFRGDDETATRLVIREITQPVTQILADPSNPEGPLVVVYDCDPTTSTGQKGFVVENKDGDDFFAVDNQSKTVVSGKGLVVTTVCSGGAFDKVDDHTVATTKDTVVLRDGATGTCSIANLRVDSRETNLNAQGLAPDGGPPGLFFTKGACSEHLHLLQNARVSHETGTRQYRFGVDSAGFNTSTAGLHFVETSGSNDEIRMVLHDDDRKLVVRGNFDPLQGNKPLVEFECNLNNIALKTTGKVDVTGRLEVDGDVEITGSVDAISLGVGSVDATSLVVSTNVTSDSTIVSHSIIADATTSVDMSVTALTGPDRSRLDLTGKLTAGNTVVPADLTISGALIATSLKAGNTLLVNNQITNLQRLQLSIPGGTTKFLEATDSVANKEAFSVSVDGLLNLGVADALANGAKVLQH